VSGAYRVDLVHLAQVIDQLDRFDRYLESALEQADRQVNQVHGTWTGQAAQAHLAAHDEWKRGAVDMRDGLATMRSIASTAHGNYTDAATVNAQMWAQAV
jgi:WXG100 family type VII secretion target